MLFAIVIFVSDFLIPFHMLAIFFHELGHATTTILTGGHVFGIVISAFHGGVTYSSGGWRPAVASGGYLGNTIVGCLLIYLASKPDVVRTTMKALGYVLAISAVLFGRSPLTILFAAASGYLFHYLATEAEYDVVYWTLKFTAVCIAAYAVSDLVSLIRIELGAPHLSLAKGAVDSTKMARLTGIPAVTWAVIWASVSYIAVWVTVYVCTPSSKHASTDEEEIEEI